jgi:serine/threonine protein kinase
MVASGNVLQNRYEIEEMLGQGGFGAVYRARDNRLKKQVAIKETLHLKPDMLRLFEREAEVLALLEHPSLPAVTDYFNEDENYYIVMTYVPGEDLVEYLERQPQKRLDESKALEIIVPVLEALDYLHTREPPVIHRDIKPGNIRITPDEKVYLVDFGMAKTYDANARAATSVMAFTPTYAPPEQYYQRTDTRSDIYAVGATLYVMLSGTTPTAAHERMADGDLVPLRQHNPDVSPQTEQIITRMMAMQPDERHQTAAEVREDVFILLESLASSSIAHHPSANSHAAETELHTNRLATEPDYQVPRTFMTAALLTRPQPRGTSQSAEPVSGPDLALVGQPTIQLLPHRKFAPILGVVSMAVVALLAFGITSWMIGTSDVAANNIRADGSIDVAGSTVVNDLSQVQQSVVKIEAEGAFAYPDEEADDWIGRGSGFIIDSSGLAVTNNHVVAGAGTLEVTIAGEERSRMARVVGTSECLDLAVIDIEGDDFHTLPWASEPITPGLDVFTAGFPHGANFKLTQGELIDLHARGNTAWASLDGVLAHSAPIHPGSSGGPLVTADGQIIGVNYRPMNPDTMTDRGYALGREGFRAVIEQLMAGADVLSIGVNSEVLRTTNGAGVWVYAVESGSLADLARLRPGDIITHMEGVALVDDGTMSKYCRVLRSHGPEDAIQLRVVRSESATVLEGQLNGRELEPVADQPLVAQSTATAELLASESTMPISEQENQQTEVIASIIRNTPTITVTPLPTGTASPTAMPTATPEPTATAPAATVDVASDVEPLTGLDSAAVESWRQAYQERLATHTLRLQETFDTPGLHTRWREYNDTPQFSQRITNFYYEVLLKQPNTTFIDYWSQRRLGNNYLVQLDVAFASPGLMSSVGIVYDMQDNANMAQFLISGDGTWEHRMIREGAFVAQHSGTFPTDTIQGADPNQLRVVRSPESVEFWINNTPVGTAQAGPFDGGYAGMVAMSAEDAPIVVLIDNMYVWE